MSHITHQVTAVAISNLPQASVVPVPWVGTGTADDQSGLEQAGIGGELLVVEEAGTWEDSVWEGLEVDGGGGDLLLGGVVTMGEMTTIWETKTHDPVLWVDERGERGEAGNNEWGLISQCESRHINRV